MVRRCEIRWPLSTRNDPAAAREMRHHDAGLYSDETSLMLHYARFAEAALRNGTTLIAGAPYRHAARPAPETAGAWHRYQRCDASGTYLALEVPATLSRFIVDGRLDEARFWNAASGLAVAGARATAGRRPRVALCGDGAATLLREGLVDAATSLEPRRDQMARTFDL